MESTKNKVLKKVLKVPSLNFSLLLIAFALIFASCKRSIPNKPWISAVPYNAPAVVVPKNNTTLTQALKSEYMPFFDDLSSSAIPIVKKIFNDSTLSPELKGMVLYPNSSTSWQPVWIVRTKQGNLTALSENFYRNFTENHYRSDGIIINKLHVDNRIIYVSQIKNWGFISENSYGIEQAIRSYLGKTKSIAIKEADIRAGTLILNGGYLDQWLNQESAVRYRPYLLNAFKGLAPADLNVYQTGSGNTKNLHINGEIPLDSVKHSALTQSISSLNDKPTLDQYIPSDAAAFALLRLPAKADISDSMKVDTKADSLLRNDNALIQSIAKTINPEFSFVAFDPSGYLNIGENLFIRKLEQPAKLQKYLSELANKEIISRQGDGYYVRSTILAHLIGSPLCTYKTFYLGITGHAAILSPRMGLTNRIITDRSHNRVLYYTDIYGKIRNNIPTKFSALFYAKNNRLYRYLKYYLDQENNVPAITSKFDVLSATLQRDPSGKKLKFNLQTYTTKQSNRPYIEKWIFPMDGGHLTGKPILADMGGSNHNEIIVTTDKGNIYSLASDGTVLMHTHTIGDTPIGSPIVYDWYGNNQRAIMVAAGNKIYAWNQNGDLLPKFPLKLDETITAPITIADVTHDGLPEIIVATADRKLHVLNGRGRDISGWPISTNTVIKKQPIFKELDGISSIWAVAENSLFAWNRNGALRKGFPIFSNASFTTRPVFFNNNVLLGSADGHLYTIGKQRMLSDSMNVYRHTTYDSLGNGLKMGALYVSNTAINGAPSVQDVPIRIDSSTVKKENAILLQSNNGAIFLYNTKGKLRFTQNMGQPSATDSSPFVTDLRGNNNQDIVSLANYGRLYAWNILSGERMYNLPTSAMQYPIVTDLDGNGEMELIAQTQEGLQCWTLSNKPATATK